MPGPSETEVARVLAGEWNDVYTHLRRIEAYAARHKRGEFQLVNRRQARGRRTIITTNRTAEQLQADYQESRLWDRLLRAWRYVKCDGPNLRQRGGQ